MILKRMRGEPSSLSAALSQASSSPSVTASIPSATYEEVKRRLVMGMNTSTQMTVQMPTAATSARPPPSTLPEPKPTATKSGNSTAGMSAIRKVTAGLTGISKSTAAKAAAVKVLSSETKTVKKLKQSSAPRGGKRKRHKSRNGDEDDGSDDNASSISGFSLRSQTADQHVPPSENTLNHTPSATPLAVTKSGRQVLKPAAYNPAAIEAASSSGGGRKRAGAHYGGKRTAEQALCRKCTRMHSPASNQIVFCDGCNDAWHQLCHEPWIGNDTVRDQTKGWFCGACRAKRERHLFKRQRVEGGAAGAAEQGVRISWASRPVTQKRAYLSTLSQQQLVGLLMASLELHPDLPIFPASSSSSAPVGTPRSLFAGTSTEGLFPRAEAHPTGQINFVRKIANGGGARSVSGKGKPSGSGSSGGAKSIKEDSQERTGEEDDEFDPLAALWPKPGMGLYMRLPADTEDDARLVDDADYEAFSVIVYDERGRKLEENGMKV